MNPNPIAIVNFCFKRYSYVWKPRSAFCSDWSEAGAMIQFRRPRGHSEVGSESGSEVGSREGQYFILCSDWLEAGSEAELFGDLRAGSV